MQIQVNRHYVDISTWTMVRFFSVILGLVLLYMLRDIVAILLFAVVLASAMEPAIEWFQRLRVPRILSTILIFLAAISTLVFAVYLIVPLLAEELQGFTLTYPIFERQVLREIQGIGNLPFIDFIRENARGLLAEPSQYISGFSSGVVSFTSGFFGGAFSVVILIVVSFYLAIKEKGIEDFIRIALPLKYESYSVDLWLRAQKKMGQWLRAQLLLGALIGVGIYLGLTLLNVKYALVFAFIAAIFELVPIAGPILAAVPATLIAFLQSPFLALMVIILYVVVQQLESHIVVPLVMKTTFGISPIVVVIALLIGAELAGILGLLLAVPVTAVLVELLNDFDKKKRRQSSA
ncbi:MAG: AI-2E family transporter [Candidatus Sungbacteria bacterium]|nr:AI-2E family transporter [Candidatus Sungbacteria bacterium]